MFTKNGSHTAKTGETIAIGNRVEMSWCSAAMADTLRTATVVDIAGRFSVDLRTDDGRLVSVLARNLSLI